MVEAREFQVGEQRFVVGQLPAMKAIKLLNRMGAIVGPALAKVAGAASGGLADMDAAQLGDAAKLLFDNLPDAQLESFLRDLFSTVTLLGENGKVAPVMQVFDTVFQGRLEDVFALTRHALEVNYGSFLGGLGAKLAALPTASASKGSTA